MLNPSIGLDQLFDSFIRSVDDCVAYAYEEPYLDEENVLLRPPSSNDDSASTIWHEFCLNSPADTARCTLDSTSFYMLGDNRRESFDSRGFGPVPEENIVGRAFFRIWPLSEISTL